jgi:hypothetical protein
MHSYLADSDLKFHFQHVRKWRFQEVWHEINVTNDLYNWIVETQSPSSYMDDQSGPILVTEPLFCIISIMATEWR